MKDIKFIKQSNCDKENINKYILKTNSQELGYASIDPNNSKNNIYFFIYPQHRSNGFGFLLFTYLIKELKETIKLPSIELDIDKTNIHANNIIAKSGGLLLAEDSKTHWVLKL